MKVFDHHFLAAVCRAQGEEEVAAAYEQTATKWIQQQATLHASGRPTDALYTWTIRLELELLEKPNE